MAETWRSLFSSGSGQISMLLKAHQQTILGTMRNKILNYDTDEFNNLTYHHPDDGTSPLHSFGLEAEPFIFKNNLRSFALSGFPKTANHKQYVRNVFYMYWTCLSLPVTFCFVSIIHQTMRALVKTFKNNIGWILYVETSKLLTVKHLNVSITNVPNFFQCKANKM